jgi:hypothetical protein
LAIAAAYLGGGGGERREREGREMGERSKIENRGKTLV